MKNYKAMNDKTSMALGTVPAGKKVNVPQSRSENSGEERNVTTCQAAKANRLGRSLTPKANCAIPTPFLICTSHK
jgi:hypothetical protein